MWEEGRVVAPQDREVVQEYKATEGERERERGVKGKTENRLNFKKEGSEKG